MCGLIVVDADSESLEVPAVALCHLGDQRFGGDARCVGSQHGRRTVRVARADIDAAVTAHALEPCPDVGLGVFHQVPQVQRPAGIGQGAGHQDIALLGHWAGLQKQYGKIRPVPRADGPRHALLRSIGPYSVLVRDYAIGTTQMLFKG